MRPHSYRPKTTRGAIALFCFTPGARTARTRPSQAFGAILSGATSLAVPVLRGLSVSKGGFLSPTPGVGPWMLMAGVLGAGAGEAVPVLLALGEVSITLGHDQEVRLCACALF